jgi:hypothetical protein
MALAAAAIGWPRESACMQLQVAVATVCNGALQLRIRTMRATNVEWCHNLFISSYTPERHGAVHGLSDSESLVLEQPRKMRATAALLLLAVAFLSSQQALAAETVSVAKLLRSYINAIRRRSGQGGGDGQPAD